MIEWSFCGPIIAARLRDLFGYDLDEMKMSVTIMKIVTHLRNDFAVKLVEAFCKVRNPFEEQPLTKNLVAKIIVPRDSVESIRTAYAIGERQSIQFVDQGLIRNSVSLCDKIKMIKLPLFSQRIERKPSRAERTVTPLKPDCRLFEIFT